IIFQIDFFSVPENPLMPILFLTKWVRQMINWPGQKTSDDLPISCLIAEFAVFCRVDPVYGKWQPETEWRVDNRIIQPATGGQIGNGSLHVGMSCVTLVLRPKQSVQWCLEKLKQNQRDSAHSDESSE
ncbi:MAG: hypothetical protein V3U85_01845, partial [Hyphomicrobium sp.]